MTESIKDRLILFIEYKGISIRSFEESCGFSNGFVSKAGDTMRKQNVDKISTRYPELNTVWLRTGDGQMLKTSTEGILINEEHIPPGANYRLVPVVHVDSVGGIYSYNEVTQSEQQFIEGYVPFVNAKEGDKAIFQTGNSMIPTCPPGSLLQVREVPNWKEYFGYGNIFVIELTDGRRITKEVNRFDENPREYVWCKSHNPDVADEELPKSLIRSVWKVIKILTDKGW